MGGQEELGCRGMAGQPYRRQEALSSGSPADLSDSGTHRDPTIQRRPGAVENLARPGTERRPVPFTFRPLSAPFPLVLLSSHFGFATASCDRGNENKGSGAGRRAASWRGGTFHER